MALFAVGIGAFGPIYLHSADQAILDQALASAPPGDTGLTLEPASATATAARLVGRAAAAPRPPGGRRWFGSPLVTEDVGLSTESGGQAYGASLVSRTGVCAHVAVTGRCPRSPGDVLLSARTARELGVGIGQTIVVSVARADGPTALRVVGLYQPAGAADPYWWGADYFAFGTGPPMKPLLDGIFTVPQTLSSSAPASSISLVVQVPYQPGTLAVDDVGRLGTALRQYQGVSTRYGVLVSTRMPALLSGAATSSHTTAGIVAVVDVQLVLLSLFAVYFVVNRTAFEREPDVRLAALRGFRPRTTLAVAMAEPAAVMCAAVPAGLVGAWLVVWAGAGSLFGPGVGATMTPLAVGVAAATGVVGLASCALGIRSMLASVGADARLDDPVVQGRSSTFRVVADVAVVAVAVAAFVELAVSGVSGGGGTSHTDPLAALSPGVLALAFGVLGARLLPAVLRATLGRTAWSPSVAWTLATRRVARGRDAAPHVVLLALAVGLATFAVSGWAVAGRNQSVRREFDVGAAKVLTVRVRPGVDFRDAVRRADPAGRSAMAVVVENATDGTTLAVDSARMGSVMSWPVGLGAGGATQAAARLVPSGLAPSVTVSGSALRVTLDAAVDAQPPPQLSAVLYDKGFQSLSDVVLGTLAPGTATYESSIAGLCPVGCRLVDLAVTWTPSLAGPAEPSGTATLAITALDERSADGQWTPVAAGLGDRRRWSTPSGGVRLQSTASGLQAQVELNPFGVPLDIAPADSPTELPAVVTDGAATSATGAGGSLSLVGLDGDTVPGAPVGTVPALPRVGDVAALVDLGMAERFLSGPFSSATTEVWLSASAPPGFGTRLASLGIAVTGVDSTVARRQAARHGGVTLAYTLFLVSAVAAAALAVGATAFAVAAGARRRQGELAAVRAVGIPVASVRRFLEAEQLLVVGTGVVLGTAAGLTAAMVALRSVPEFSVVEPGPPLQLGLPPVVLGVLLAAVALLMAGTAAVGSSIVAGGATADKLGGVQE